MSAVSTSAISVIDGGCKIEHYWCGDQVQLNVWDGNIIAIELYIEDEAFDKLLEAVAAADAQRQQDLAALEANVHAI